MRKGLRIGFLMLVGSMGGVAASQPAPGALGFHEVTLSLTPTDKPVVLVETRHLKVTTVRIPKGKRLPVHAVPEQLSIQVLAGSGEVKLEHGKKPIDRMHMLVLAPGMDHDVRASAKEDLVLLVHHVLPGPYGRGRGRGGRGRGLGPGR